MKSSKLCGLKRSARGAAAEIREPVVDVLAFLAERPGWSLLAALSAARRFWVELLPLAGVTEGGGCDGLWVVSFLDVEMPPKIGANPVLCF